MDDTDDSSDECFRRSDGDDFKSNSDQDEEARAKKAAHKANYARLRVAWLKRVRENKSDSDDEEVPARNLNDYDSSDDECFRRRDGDNFETELDHDEEAMKQKAERKAKFAKMYAAFIKRVRENDSSDSENDDPSAKIFTEKESEENENNDGNDNKTINGQKISAEKQFVGDVLSAQADVSDVESEPTPIDNKQFETEVVRIGKSTVNSTSQIIIHDKSGIRQAVNPRNFLNLEQGSSGTSNNFQLQDKTIGGQKISAEKQFVGDVLPAQTDVSDVESAPKPIDNKQFETEVVSIGKSTVNSTSQIIIHDKSGIRQAVNPRNFLNLEQGSSGTSNNFQLQHNNFQLPHKTIGGQIIGAESRFVVAEDVNLAQPPVLEVELVPNDDQSENRQRQNDSESGDGELLMKILKKALGSDDWTASSETEKEKADPISKKTIMKKKVSKKSRKDADELYRPAKENMNIVHPRMVARPTRSSGNGSLSKGLQDPRKKQRQSKFVKEEEKRFNRS